MDAKETKEDVRATEGGENPHINLRVVWQDGGEVFFKIKKSTQMSKLFKAYCKREGREEDAVRFLFDGQPIKPDDTPLSLGLDENDMIDAMPRQVGGQ